jgi:hypothetical protein
VPVNPAEKYKPKPVMDAAPGSKHEEMTKVPFREMIPGEMIGSLSYIARLCHASIAFGVSDLAQYVSNYGRSHWKIT